MRRTEHTKDSEANCAEPGLAEIQKDLLVEELKGTRAESLAYLTAQTQVLNVGSALLLGELAVVGALVNSNNLSHTWHWMSLAAGTTSCLTGFALTGQGRTLGHLASFERDQILPELERLAKRTMPSWVKYKHQVNRTSKFRTEIAASPYGLFLFAGCLSEVAFVGFTFFRSLQLGSYPWMNELIGMHPLRDASKAYDPPYLYHWLAWTIVFGMMLVLIRQGAELRKLANGANSRS